jgi:alkanesulfonate monooxygenase SsuD/methylene tetrahydromethanopterin reductase-like flavin-dependent oxidoreductase (luciferase family)
MAAGATCSGVMRFGAHLPVADFGEGCPDGARLRQYASTANELGFHTLAANDHVLWRRPWLDGPTALASVVGEAGGMRLATSVALPAVRHPVVLAKALASLAVLSGGPVIAGLGPGSSNADYRAADVPFEERWARFDEAVPLVRSLLRGEPVTAGHFYGADGIRLDPLPKEPPGVWFGSWGSDKRLRNMAAASDGWLASGYNTTPARFAEARARLDDHLRVAGRDPAAFPDLIATMWLYVTEERHVARQLLDDVLAPVLGRDAGELAQRLPIGPTHHCIELLSGYAAAGAQEILLWPIHDPIGQLHTFAERVRPHVGPSPDPPRDRES